jgi:hypothetical protein
MAALGLGPIAAGNVGANILQSPNAPGLFEWQPSAAKTGFATATLAPPTPNAILCAAFKSGLVDRATLAAVLEKESYRSIDYEATVERYKAFSPIAKRRLIEQAKRDRALVEFLDDDKLDFWGLVRKFGG